MFVCVCVYKNDYYGPPQVETIEDTVQTLLKKIGKEEVASDQLKEFKKRKLINNE